LSYTFYLIIFYVFRFKKIPISHILAAPDTKSLKTATQISKNLKTIRVKYDPGFAKVYEMLISKFNKILVIKK